MSDWYVLDDAGEPVKTDPMTGGLWFEDNADKCRVAETHVGPARVSTVFLSLDHAVRGGPPVLWETRVFWPGHDMDGDERRYHTRAEAEAGHREMCERVRAEQH